MKILITGSKGYIGVALYNALKDRYKVVGLSKEDIDLTDLNQVKEFFQNKYFDVVIHCAIVGGGRLDVNLILANYSTLAQVLKSKIHFMV